MNNKISKFLTDNDIDKLFNKRKWFLDLLNNNKLNIFRYIIGNFKLNIDLKDFLDFTRNNNNDDAKIYKYIRNIVNNLYLEKCKINNKSCSNINIADELKKDNLVYYRNELVPHKISQIDKTISNWYKPFIKKYLDIGTEDEYFIDSIEKKFKCEAYGLNIEEGYEHYFEGNKNKIIIYDGINFPFKENEFDMVSIISVLHHINEKLIEKWMNNMCKITKAVFIKDNNTIDDNTIKNIEIQHEIYEGVLYPNYRSPINLTLTYDIIAKNLEKNNFKIIYKNIKDEFTRSFVLFAVKKNIKYESKNNSQSRLISNKYYNNYYKFKSINKANIYWNNLIYKGMAYISIDLKNKKIPKDIKSNFKEFIRDKEYKYIGENYINNKELLLVLEKK
jgi:hypothetical protein